MKRYALVVCLVFLSTASEAQEWLRDRGNGVPTSMFATFIGQGQWIVYPFFEYYKDKNFEYKPQDFGYGVPADLRGSYRATEKQIFVAYGVTDRLAFEFETSTIKATLNKALTDSSGMPARITQTGIGALEGQVRYRWLDETATRPELFSFSELVVPHEKSKALIGTADTEVTFGTGIIKGLRIGTVSLTLSAARTGGSFDPGLAVEYMRRLSERTLVYTGIEAHQDEVEWIQELQFRLNRHVTLKLNNAFGLTSKATDWAPEVGVMFRF